MAISLMASSTLRIRSKVHSAPSNSGLTFVVLRFGSFGSFVVVTALSLAFHGGFAPLGSRGSVAGGEQLMEHRVDILRRRHAACREVLVAAGDQIVAMPHGGLVRVVEALAVSGLDVGEVLADGQH